MISSRWLIPVLALAVFARVGAAITIGSGFHFADEAIYVDTAQRLASGGGFGDKYSGVPGYPVFLALVSLGQAPGIIVLRMLQAAVAALGSLFLFFLAERIVDRRAALLAALTYALDPLLVITSGLLYPETVAAVLLIAIVLLALGASERDLLSNSAWAGGLLAILAMLRPVALVLPSVVAAWIALTVVAKPARRTAHLATLGLTFALVLTPWIARNFRIHHKLVPVTTQGSLTAPVDRSEVDRQGLLPSLAEWAWHDPEALISRVSRQFVQFWELAPTRMVTDDPAKREELHRQNPRLEVKPLFSTRVRDRVGAASFCVELVLALVGIAVVIRTRRRQALLLLLVILAYALGYALFVAKLRYRIPLLPLLFVFSGAGAAALYSLLRRAAARNHQLPRL